MATENQELALKLAIAIQDDNPTSDRIDFLAGGLEDGFLTRDGVRASLINTTEGGQDLFPSGQGTEEQRETIVTTLFERLFDRQPDQAGLDYWVSGGGSSVNADQLPQAFIDGSGQQDRATLNNKVDALADEIGLGEDDGGGSGQPGDTVELTETADNLDGTEDNDTFEGAVGQNQNGALANALATGDSIDGGAGNDTIETSMINDETVEGGGSGSPRPVTENVQNVFVEALDTNGEVTLDAARMQNVEQFWSDFSTTDFTVENVSLRGNNLGITKDITFGMRDVEQGSGLTAHFETNALKSAPDESQNSQLEIRIADVSTETPDTPLANVSLTLGFTLGGESFELTDVTSTDGTYQGLVDAMNTAFAAQGLTQLQVELDESYEQVDVANNTVNLPFTAREILVTDPDGEEFGSVDFTQESIESVPDGFLVAGNAQPVDPTVTSNLIESNLVLDNAGRGSVAGDVEIGGNSGSNINVEQLNVSVDRTSAISSLQRTFQGPVDPVDERGNQFEIINISSAENEGDLTIQDLVGNATNAEVTNKVNANSFVGDLTIGTTGAANVAEFSATGGGDVTYVGDYQTGLDHTIETGGGNDVLDVNVAGATSVSGRSETTVEITSGSGSDAIELTNNNTVAAITEQNNQAVVNAGTGADTVTGHGTDLVANAGGGNDAIYAENTGEMATAFLRSGDATSGLGSDTVGDNSTVNMVNLLNGRDVQVTVNVPGDNPSDEVSAFTDGFETTATVEASNGEITSERDLYNAVAESINSDETISDLATASVNSSGDLVVDYKVDGDATGNLSLVEIEPLGNWADGSTNNLLTAIQDANNDSSITDGDLEGIFNDNAVGENDAPGDGSQVTADAVNGAAVNEEQTLTITADDANDNDEGLDVTYDTDGSGNTNTVSVDLSSIDPTVKADVANEVVSVLNANGDFSNDATAAVDGSDNVTITYDGALSGQDINGVVSATATGTTGTLDGAGSVDQDGAPAGLDTTGSDSTTNGENVVNAGNGEDTIVLSSNDETAQADTVVFDAGSIGVNSIAHFNDGNGNSGDQDVLDFTAWLNNVESSSDSTETESPIGTSFVDATGGGTASANEVLETTFSDIDSASANNLGFAGLSGAEMLDALNNNGTFSSDDESGSNLVGDVQNSLFLVQNGDNEGEYKAFQVTSDATSDANDSFQDAQLIGTLDFGESQDLGDANLA